MTLRVKSFRPITPTSGQPVRLAVTAPALLGAVELLAEPQPMVLAPVSTRAITVRVRSQPSGGRGTVPIEFILASAESGEGARQFKVVEKSRFVIP